MYIGETHKFNCPEIIKFYHIILQPILQPIVIFSRMVTKISFRLKNNKPGTLISLHVNCGLKEVNLHTGTTMYRPIIMSTGKMINPENWSKENYRPTKEFSKKDKRILIELNKWEVAAEEGVQWVRDNKEVEFNNANIKKAILWKMNGNKNNNPIQEIVCFSEFIEDVLNTQKFNKNTLKTHRSFNEKVKAFETQYGKINLLKLTPSTIRKFLLDFLPNSGIKSNNALNKLQGEFSTFMRMAEESGIKVGCQMKEANVKFQRYKPDNIFLNLAEIKALMDVSLEPFSELDKARDVFLIMCFTGQRISDYHLMSECKIISKIIKGKRIEYVKVTPPILNNKKKEVVVPILKPVKDILAKWDGFPMNVVDQSVNRCMKWIAEQAGISEVIERTAFIYGNQTEVKRNYKFELLTNHVARATFITVALDQLHISDSIVSSITGHRRSFNASKAFAGYVRTTKEENAANFIFMLKKNIESGVVRPPMQLV